MPAATAATERPPRFPTGLLDRNVRSHILERVEAEGQDVGAILQAVGDPKHLASEYETQALLRHAVKSQSPWVLLRTTRRWAMTGVAGTVAFLVTLVGYGSATVFYLCALLKPLFPSRIGLWLAPQQTLTFGYWNGRLSGTELYGVSVRPPGSLVLGTLGPTDGPVRELLGYWVVPVGVVGGVLLVLATTLVTRWLVVRFGQRNASLSLVELLAVRPVASRTSDSTDRTCG